MLRKSCMVRFWQGRIQINNRTGSGPVPLASAYVNAALYIQHRAVGRDSQRALSELTGTAMRLTCALFLAAVACARAQLFPRPLQFLPRGCNYDATADYKLASNDFATKLYRLVGSAHNNHFILSQNSVWSALAAFAEGVKNPAQDQLFKILSLPNEACRRELYYNVSKGLEKSGDDVKLDRKRYIVFDKVRMNETWATVVSKSGLAEVGYAPLRDTEAAYEKVKDYIDSPESKLLSLNFSGNSIITDSLDYEGLWTAAFPVDSIERNAPFFDDFGNRIGTVDLLRMKKRVKMAYLPITNAKVLELPVGTNSRYRFVMIQNIGKNPIGTTVQNYVNSFITDMFKYFQESLVPLEIAIPRMEWTHDIPDMRQILEKMGITSLWVDGNMTQSISQPAALPSSYVQRNTIRLNAGGVTKQEPEPPKPFLVSSISALAAQAAALTQRLADATGLPAALGREFIANRPFMFALVEPKNQMVLFSGVYSKPPLPPS